MFLLVSALFAGCSRDNRSPIEKANELLTQRGLMTVQHLDSVFGYKDAHNCMMAACNLQSKADSILDSHQANKTLLSAEDKKEASELSQTVYNLKVQAASNTLKHELAKDKKEFLGFSALIADSIKGTVVNVYFDKDITKIAATERK